MTPNINIDGLCIYAFPCLEQFPSPRRVLSGYLSAGNKNMTVENCKQICKGLNLKNNLNSTQISLNRFQKVENSESNHDDEFTMTLSLPKLKSNDYIDRQTGGSEK